VGARGRRDPTTCAVFGESGEPAGEASRIAVRESPLRASVQELLAFDLSVCAAVERGGLPDANGTSVCWDRSPDDVLTATASLCQELRLWGRLALAGFDEAGRGALAGPVAVGCVHFDLASTTRRESFEKLFETMSGLDDSKRLSPEKRDRLAERITRLACWSVGYASAVEIDRMGIVPACRLAARRAYRRLSVAVDVVLLDRGLSLMPVCAREAVGREAAPTEFSFTRGDARSFHIAAASIVAKVSRDTLMKQLESSFPGHGLAKHKGYGTAAHQDAIRRLGPSRIHRRTFLRRI
jgi:ribonuclease HII